MSTGFNDNYVDQHHFLSFYHRKYPTPDSEHYHGAPFADSVDSTAIWLTQCKMNGTKTDDEIRMILFAGLSVRTMLDGRILRYPGGPEIGKDQLDFLIPLMRSVGYDHWADKIVEKYGDTRLPHRRNHLLGKNTWLGRKFEVLDSIVDWFSDSLPSQMNNIARLLWGAYNGKPNYPAMRMFQKRLRPYWILVVYGRQRPGDTAGKYGEEKRLIQEKNYRDALTKGPTVMDPPPIYEGYLEILHRLWEKEKD